MIHKWAAPIVASSKHAQPRSGISSLKDLGVDRCLKSCRSLHFHAVPPGNAQILAQNSDPCWVQYRSVAVRHFANVLQVQGQPHVRQRYSDLCAAHQAVAKSTKDARATRATNLVDNAGGSASIGGARTLAFAPASALSNVADGLGRACGGAECRCAPPG